MKNLERQRGLSTVGWLVVIVLFGFGLMVVAKLGPHYLDNRYVIATLKTIAEDPNFPTMSVSEVKEKLRKTFFINNVRGKPLKSMKVVKTAKGTLVTIEYEERLNLFYNIDVVLVFNNQLDSSKPDLCCEPI